MNDTSTGYDFQSSSHPQRKKWKIYCDCVIHFSDCTEKLVSPESLESWNIILRAAKILYHKAVLDVAKEIDCSTVSDISTIDVAVALSH